MNKGHILDQTILAFLVDFFLCTFQGRMYFEYSNLSQDLGLLIFVPVANRNDAFFIQDGCLILSCWAFLGPLKFLTIIASVILSQVGCEVYAFEMGIGNKITMSHPLSALNQNISLQLPSVG